MDYHSKLNSRQKARELYSIVKNREEKRTQAEGDKRSTINALLNTELKQSELNSNLYAKSSVKTQTTQRSTDSCVQGSCDPTKHHQSDQMVSSACKASSHANAISTLTSTMEASPGIIQSTAMSPVPKIPQVYDSLSSQLDTCGRKCDHSNNRNNPQIPITEWNELDSATNGTIPNRYDLKLAQSLDHLVEDRSKQSAFKSTVDLTNRCAVDDSLVESIRGTDTTNVTTDLTDPEQLLSSLSKLNFDPSQGNHMWDDSYFSDVESEYAALELLLPFSRSFKEQENTTGFIDAKEEGKRLEAGYFSDTETIFAAKSAIRQPAAVLTSFAGSKLTGSDSPLSLTVLANNHVKTTPIASVAPIMAHRGKSLGSSHVSLHTQKTPIESSHRDPCLTLDAFEAEIAIEADGLFDFDHMKWPRLRSARSISHAISNDKVMEIQSTGEANLPQPGLLDHIKLPYPKPNPGAPISGQSVRTSASNYALNQKTANSPTTSLPENPLRAGPSLFQLDAIGSGRHSLVFNSSESQQEMERLKEELRRSNQQVNELTARLKDKDFEINDLKSTVNQLRNDMTKIQANSLMKCSVQPRPPRSTSCRAIPDNSRQQHDSHETVSLSSLISGTGASVSSSQDAHAARIHSPGLESLARNSPSPTSDIERTPGKRSRWIRPALGKAFKKRSKSTMNTSDRSETNAETCHQNCGPTATICNNPGIVRSFLPPSPDRFTNHATSSSFVQADQSAQNLLLHMRWELSCLEADNQRLRRLILNTPSLTDPPDGRQGTQQNVISLADLSARHCAKGDQALNVFIELEPSPLRNAFQKSQNTTNESSNQGKPTKDESATNKLMKIGCIGVPNNSTSWDDLDEKIQTLLEDYVMYLGPAHGLSGMKLNMKEYTVQCSLRSESQASKLMRQRPDDGTGAKMRFADNCQQIPPCSPSTWIRDHVKASSSPMAPSFSVMVHLEGSFLSPSAKAKPNFSAVNELAQLNLLSFETLIPVTLLRDYLKQMREHRFIILCGPTGTRKTRILHKVAELLVQDVRQPNSIRSFYVRPNGSTMVKELQCFVAQHLATYHRHGIPQVMILENLHHVQGSLIEMLETLGKVHPTPWPVILATSDLLNDELKMVETRFPVHFIEHLTDLDSTACYLSSYLKRKLAQARLFVHTPLISDNSKQSENEDSTLAQLVNWIPKVWKHLNQLSNKQQQSCPAIFGLRIFLACPIDVAASKHWFTDLWNNLFIPFLFKTRSSEEVSGTAHSVSLADSFDWIMATWPWPRETSDVMGGTSTGHVSELMKLTDTSLYLPPLTPCNSTSKHSSFSTHHHVSVSAKNRTSQDSGIISDGYLNMCGLNPDKRCSKGSEVSDRVTSSGITNSDSLDVSSTTSSASPLFPLSKSIPTGTGINRTQATSDSYVTDSPFSCFHGDSQRCNFPGPVSTSTSANNA